MSSYSPPPQEDEKEKIIGGLLTFQQGVWLASGLLIAFGVVILLHSIIPFFLCAFLGLLIGGAFSFPFAFKKVHDLTLFRYLTLNRAFKKKEKFLPNKREI